MNRRFIDAHTHFIDPDQFEYWWMAPPLDKRFDTKVHEEHVGELNLEKVVFVQADVPKEQSLQEVEWVLEMAESYPRIQGIVAYTHLSDGMACAGDLEAYSKIPMVKGVRQHWQLEEKGFCLQPQLIEAIQTLPSYDLSLDICIVHHQLEEVIELVRQCPDVKIVLDHLAKPDAKTPAFEPWATHLTQLASYGNVMCKISGLVTEADHENWTEEGLKPFIDQVIQSFGHDRIMFGGDWPVCLFASDYQRWVATADRATIHFSEEEKDKFFYKNGEAFYRL